MSKIENLPSKKTVLIIQPILAHYRKSLFSLLTNSPEFDIHIIAGKNIGNVKEIDLRSSKILANLHNKKIIAGKHSFIWQKGAVSYAKKLKPDIIVLTGVDPHLLSNLFVSIFNKIYFHSKIIWWGHANINPHAKIANIIRRFFFNLGNGIFTYSIAGMRNMQLIVNRKVAVSVVKNCINNEEYGFTDSTGFVSNQNYITVLFSGRITREKRLDILIDAIAILKTKNVKTKCLIIGDGPLRAVAEKQVSDLNLTDSINFLGELYENDSRLYFRQADIFVLPGKVGLSIIHGLSYGLPVLTSNKFEIHSPEYEIIEPGYNGDFFSGFNPGSLAEKIAEWGNIIKVNKATISEKCMNSVKNGGYTPEDMSEKMIDLFKKMSIE